jgi:chemotaxis protein methyltransferase CheR
MSMLTPALHAILGGIVEERTGIHYGPSDHDIFASKVMACAVESGFESPLDYYYALRYDDPRGLLLDALCESLVVNETYFFREAEPLRVLCEMLTTRLARHERPRVWCAAAATGEEPLTLAMMLAERGLSRSIEIVASDISRVALERAQRGIYRARSFRVPNEAFARYFREEGDQRVVNRALRESIEWKRVNLVDTLAIEALGSFDAILCRNVLIYFSEQTIRDTVARLTSALRPDGVILVGASESLMRFGTRLRCEERGGAFFYERAA